MIFFSFFKTLVGKEVAVEMKNDVVMIGLLVSVDQYLNVKLKNVSVVDSVSHPQLASMKTCFIRGSAVRQVFSLPFVFGIISTTILIGIFKFPPVK